MSRLREEGEGGDEEWDFGGDVCAACKCVGVC